MNLVSPERLIWLGVALPIIVFYLLKTRLRRQRVSTLMFWDELFDQKRQRSWLQRLRHWLSLLLQLAFVLLVAFALADPLWQGQEDSRQQIVLVLDNSASMNAIEADGQSRLEIARERAVEAAKSLRSGDEMALVTAGSVVRVVVGMTDFAPAIRDAVLEIEATDGPTRVNEAVQTARRLAADIDHRQIQVISDFAFPDSEELLAQQDVRIVLIGGPLDNVGITQLQVRRSLVDPIGYSALIELQNFGDAAVKTRLTLELGDDLVDVIPLELESNETFQHTITEASAEGGILVASIDVDDPLVTDNVARAVLPRRGKIPVTLVSQQPNLYLQSVFDAIPLVELRVTNVGPPQAPPGGFVVLHQVVPEPLPTGPVLAIDPVDDSEHWKLGPQLSQPIVARQHSESPLLPHVQLTNVVLPGSRALQVGEPATPLLESADGSVLMVSLADERNRLVVLSANLDQGDLPLRIAFPVMMTNAVNWFLGRSGELQPALSTGDEVAEVPCKADAGDNWVWRDPAGELRLAMIGDQVALIGPLDQTGIVELGPRAAMQGASTQTADAEDSTSQSLDDLVHRVAVNLSDPAESDLRRSNEIESSESDESRWGSYNVWYYLAFLALGLVVGEWFLFQRRIVG